ncbi:MAG: DUF3429 domain-containing protein [Acetobacteraceae bacterium]|nr:DUF3429 domain-containing protein [Acetobacteraceae bacterium]
MLRNQPLPPLGRGLCLVAALPFVAGALIVFLTEGWPRNLALMVLAGYGGVILSFLGAVHWGFAMAAAEPAAEKARLIGGVLPALLAWPCVTAAPPSLSCLALAGGMALVLAAEEIALRRGWTPLAYQRKRRLLALLACPSLVAAAVAAIG